MRASGTGDRPAALTDTADAAAGISRAELVRRAVAAYLDLVLCRPNCSAARGAVVAV